MVFLVGGVVLAQVPGLPVAQPVFTAEAVIPSHGTKPHPLMPGMLVTIYGRALGPTSPCVGQADRTKHETPSPPRPNQGTLETLIYPTSLCGVQVLVGAGAAGLLYVSDGQINFKAPRTTPMEGTVELRVVHRGRSSAPVTVKLGAGRPEISLDAPAYTNLPVWIRVSMPLGLGEIQYPPGIHPAAFYCYEIEVRHNGVLMTRLPNAEKRSTMPGAYSGGPCGVLGLPGERKHKGRLPLHLLYRFDQPGAYQVRLTRVDNFIQPEKTLAVSEWTAIKVLAAPPERRAEWLGEMSRHQPSDVVALLEDWLPSILGVPDEASLELILPYLYHPEPLVRRFTANGLRYWPKAEQEAVALRLLRERGPTDVTTGLLRDHSEAAVQAAIPYLHSASPVLLRGAMTVIRDLAFHPQARIRATTRSRVENAVVEAAEQVRQTADPQTLIDFAALLGSIHTAPAKETLWRWIDAGVARGQAAIAVTWQSDRADLPRLAKLLDLPAADETTFKLVGLPSALRRYGNEALPYLEQAMTSSPAVFVRTNCARELVLADRPAGFAFIADAIENDRFYKEEMIGFLKDRFVQLRPASEAEILAFVKQRATDR